MTETQMASVSMILLIAWALTTLVLFTKAWGRGWLWWAIAFFVFLLPPILGIIFG